ncbi:Doubled CXXCH motif protein [Rubripirellula obstinata]|uniref:Doubled CXXCH motif protein n=1 Tax=Rubripirellula obstinata TaxID=406547 RepID=A0A5B1CNW2_9BACT|nr:hypothetical protein [Rubripirellula obstinata]KAA1262062.1 Doubled CXXCH motif protein [Rubripirellula obstinata]
MRRDDIELANANGRDRPGDPWICSRSGQSDACQFGPDRSGRCPLADQCRPRRTWAGRKRRFSVAFLLVVAAVVGVLSWLPPDEDGSFGGSNTVIGQSIKPGELTTHHAQILATTNEVDRCIACHPSQQSSVLTSLVSWVPFFGAGAHDDLTQTDLCLQCHQNQFAPGTAMLAHNLPAEQRDQIRLASTGDRSRDWHDWLPSPSIDQESLDCNACHREHQGPNHSLTALSDAQCQTCHQDRFGAFATSHPEFVDWPYGRGGSISFNHQSHQNKHFPKSKLQTQDGESVPSFQCAACHQPTADGRITRAVDYQAACSACHDQSLQTEVAEGIELVSIPTLPDEVVAGLPSWPQSATGFFDGKLSPLAQLLIRSESGSPSSINTIPDQDFSRIDPNSRKEIEASKQIASQLYGLLTDLSLRGQTGMLERLSANASQRNRWTPVVQSFSPQLIDGAMSRWFDQPVELAVKANRQKKDRSVFQTVQYTDALDDELLGHDLADGDLLGGDLLEEDLLSGDDPLKPIESANPSKTNQRFDAEKMLVAGGWYRDDIRLAIRYRAGGHADPVLKATIEAAASLPNTDLARQGLFQNAAVSACLRCHVSASETPGAWKTNDLAGDSGQFTTFSHGPHLNIASLTDCVGCHRVKDGFVAESAATQSHWTHHPINDFDPILKQDCATCHTKAAAGDSCVLCHQYHIDGR